MPSSSLRLAIATALVAFTAGCATPGRPSPASTAARGSDDQPISQELALTTFDSVWSHIRRTYYDSTFRGLDWRAIGDELRPAAERAETIGELRATVDSLLERIGESHFVLIRREGAEQLERSDEPPPGLGGDVGMWIRFADDDLLVTWVERGSPAAHAGIRTGWSLDSVGSFSAARALEAHAALTDSAAVRLSRTRLAALAEAHLRGGPGSRVTLVLRDERGEPVRRELVRRTSPGELFQFPQLPPTVVRVRHERRSMGDGRCAGLIHFNAWMLPAVAGIERAMDDVRDCQGIVLDLRGNGGGVISMMGVVGGHFFDQPTQLGSLFARGSELRIRATPRRATADGSPARPFIGPLAVLVDALTASNSEFFTAALQQTGRARVFGQVSAGQAVPAATIRMPTGDVLMYVMANYGTPDGSRLEGSGVQPDHYIPLSRPALLAGRDEPLEAALAWLQEAGTTP